MNLTELSATIAAATDALRVETLERYASSSDHDWVAAYLRGDPPPDPAAKQGWLNRLSARRDNGHPQQRLRVVPRPVSDYVRYACEWGYLDNTAAGEDIRVLDEAEDYIEQITVLGDYWVLDGRVYAMRYDTDGAFVSADEVTGADAEVYLSKLHYGWKHGTPFSDWWTDNPSLHRDAVHA